jgi:hypothetical protein
MSLGGSGTLEALSVVISPFPVIAADRVCCATFFESLKVEFGFWDRHCGCIIFKAVDDLYVITKWV